MNKEEYIQCSEVLLKLWILNIIKDSEYNTIMDRLNQYGVCEVRLAPKEKSNSV